MSKNRQKKIVCPYCGAKAILREDNYVYGDRGRGKLLYVCSNYPRCDAYVGVHEGTYRPKGTLAKGELRNKRIRTHRIFDLIWKMGIMSKKEAYRWLKCFMGLQKCDAHIGFFSDYRCDLLMNKAKEILVNNNVDISNIA